MYTAIHSWTLNHLWLSISCYSLLAGFIITIISVIIGIATDDSEEDKLYREACEILSKEKDRLRSKSNALSWGKELTKYGNQTKSIGAFFGGEILQGITESQIEKKAAKLHPDAQRIINETKERRLQPFGIGIGLIIMYLSFMSLIASGIREIWFS